MSDPMTLVSAGLASLERARNLIQALLKARDTAIYLDEFNKLRKEIAAAIDEHLALQKQVKACTAEKENLKKEIADIKAWENQKKGYHLYRPWPGAAVYSIEEAKSNGEPPHWLCTHCFNRREKGYLQFQLKASGSRSYVCDLCKAPVFADPGYEHPVQFEYFKELKFCTFLGLRILASTNRRRYISIQ